MNHVKSIRGALRRLGLFAAMLLAFGFAGGASAQSAPDRPTRPPLIQTVDVVGSKLTIQGKTYSVTASSRLTDADGNRLTLSQLRGRSSSYGGDMIQFTATGSGASAEIRELQRLRMPEP